MAGFCMKEELLKKSLFLAGVFSAVFLTVGIAKQSVYANEENGYDCVLPHIEAESINEDGIDLYSGDAPASYVTENLPQIRNQSPYGACWTFSLAALAEINVQKQEGRMLDLSEMHMANFTYDSTQSPTGGFDGDSNVCISTNGKLGVGGNFDLGMASIANWKGYADENVLPYNIANGDAVENGKIDSSKAYSDIVHIRNYYYVDIKNDIDDAKKIIQKYGALGVDYYDNQTAFYNNRTNSYYCDTEYGANHAVTIVGWDDNFSSDNFNVNPGGNGAWLIRNSWGNKGNGWNYYGYFWLSYYDKSLDDTAIAVDCVSDTDSRFYDNNYQYDGSVYSAVCMTSGAANVFTAQKGYEQLKEVSFVTGTVNEDYVIKIYKGITDLNNPESGKLVDTMYGSTDYKGMYSVRLNNAVYLAKGEKYSVVVYLKSRGSKKTSIVCETSGSVGGRLKFTASLYPHSSYVISSGKWTDASNISNTGNVRIKAYTDNLSGLSRVSGDWNYYNNGEISSLLTTLIKYNNNWFYVKNGTIDWGYTGLVKYNGYWFYVRSGKVDFTVTTLCKYNGSWWYVRKGVVDFTATTLCKYNGYWFYVKNGSVHFSQRTLVKYNGYWFYVKNGIVNFNERTLVKYNGNWFYVNAGIVKWNYSGYCWYNGHRFRVKSGIVIF